MPSETGAVMQSTGQIFDDFRLGFSPIFRGFSRIFHSQYITLFRAMFFTQGIWERSAWRHLQTSVASLQKRLPLGFYKVPDDKHEHFRMETTHTLGVRGSTLQHTIDGQSMLCLPTLVVASTSIWTANQQTSLFLTPLI